MVTASRADSFDGLCREAGSCPVTKRTLKRTVQRAAARVEPLPPLAPLPAAREPVEPARWSPLPFLGGALVLAVVVAVLALGGCVPVEALDHVREQHAIMAGHALDESLPLEARQVGADAMRGFSVQHRVLAGEMLESPELPPELAPAGP